MTTTRKPHAQPPAASDIERAHTISTDFYKDVKYFDLARDRIFARSWQFALDTDHVAAGPHAVPWLAMDGYLNEPLVLTRDADDKIRCLSNVCTHRGNLVVDAECHATTLRCGYHGRRFAPNGHFISAPGFETAVNFPSKADDLPEIPIGFWHKLIFASIDPAFGFDELIGDMRDRLSYLPLANMVKDSSRSKDFVIDANWTLYVENYLEGLHIPFVHPALAVAIDTKDYRSETYTYSNLQIGLANNEEDAFEVPADSPDAANRIAAYYYWLFPNMMFNFYPWGLSINVVMPLEVDKTRIRYITYIYDESRLQATSPDLVVKTELEDHAIVQQVQKGIRSRVYKHGRYSPEWEQNVFHFHRLLEKFLSD
jgi:choline monooxygenase